jgi:prephenate dehydrogenase (NADP+)
MSIFAALESNIVELSFSEHDHITADTQVLMMNSSKAVTHLAFLSMGTTWKTMEKYPVRSILTCQWETLKYVGGIENVKTLMALRIYGSKWHVYGGIF